MAPSWAATLALSLFLPLAAARGEEAATALDADDECLQTADCTLQALQLHAGRRAVVEDVKQHGAKVLSQQAAAHFPGGFLTAEEDDLGGDSSEGDAAKRMNLPLYHLAQLSSWWGMGVFLEAMVGAPASDAQYVTLLLDSGSASLAMIGDKTKGTPGPLPHCTTEQFHLFHNRSRCAIGSYDWELSPSSELWPLPGSDLCPETLNVSSRKTVCTTTTCYAGGCDPETGSGYTGVDHKDYFTLGSYTAKVSMQAVVQMEGLFQEPPSSGIIGVAGKSLVCPSPEPDSCKLPALDKLLSDHGLENKLGLCLGKPPVPDKHGYLKNGQPGTLSLGGADPALYEAPMLHTGLNMHGYFAITLKGIGINGKRAVKAGTLAIVDTGDPSGLALPDDMASKFAEIGDNASCTSDSDCSVNIQLDGLCLNILGLMQCNLTTSKCKEKANNTFAYAELPMLGYQVLKDLYVELDRETGVVGFAARSAAPCSTACSAVLTEATCGFTEGCTWDGEWCSGNYSVGSTSGGSTVTEEASCFTVSADTRNAAGK